MKKLIYLSMVFVAMSFVANAQNDPTADDWVTPGLGETYTLNPLVGIGTTTPVYSLDIFGTKSLRVGANSDAGILTRSGTISSMYLGSTTSGGRQIIEYNRATGRTTFSSGAVGSENEIFNYNSLGNLMVGIGPSPVKFYVQKAAASTELMRLQNTSSIGLSSIGYTNEGAVVKAIMGYNNSTDKFELNSLNEINVKIGGVNAMVIDPSRNVGIGTSTPGTSLEVTGVITATGGTSTMWNMAHGWGDHSVPGYLTSYTETDPQVGAISVNRVPTWNGTALVTSSIFDNGSLTGIGTATPTARLEVGGDIIGTGSFAAGDFAVKGIGGNGPTHGYLGLQGANDFEGDLDLDIIGLEIGVLGRSTGGSSTDNYGVFGHSNGWGGHFQHNTSGNWVNLGGTSRALEVNGEAHITGDAHVTGNVLTDGIFFTGGLSSISNTWARGVLHNSVAGQGSSLFLSTADAGAAGTNGAQISLTNGVTPYISMYNRESGGIRLLTAGSIERLVVANDGDIGIGTNAPSARLHIQNTSSTQSYGIRVDNDYTGASTKYGIYNQTNAGGTGTRYGFFNDTDGNGSDASSVYGNYNTTTSNGSAATVYGVYSTVSSSGTGTHYGGYFSAFGNGNRAIYATNSATDGWAGYFFGNTYFSSDMRIGWTADVPGYLLAVDGKIICEELKVELSGSWPDYVFDKEHDLWSLDDVEKYINNNKHLPGVPSAECVESDGISVGEMSKIMMEKIEELTLHMIEQSKQIKDLQKENMEMHKKLNQ